MVLKKTFRVKVASGPNDTTRHNTTKVLHMSSTSTMSNCPNVLYAVRYSSTIRPLLDHFPPSSPQKSATKRTTPIGIVRLLRAGVMEGMVAVSHCPYLVRCDGLPANGAVEDCVVDVPLARWVASKPTGLKFFFFVHSSTD